MIGEFRTQWRLLGESYRSVAGKIFQLRLIRGTFPCLDGKTQRNMGDLGSPDLGSELPWGPMTFPIDPNSPFLLPRLTVPGTYGNFRHPTCDLLTPATWKTHVSLAFFWHLADVGKRGVHWFMQFSAGNGPIGGMDNEWLKTKHDPICGSYWLPNAWLPKTFIFWWFPWDDVLSILHYLFPQGCPHFLKHRDATGTEFYMKCRISQDCWGNGQFLPCRVNCWRGVDDWLQDRFFWGLEILPWL